jgi:hypothetical protein
VKTPSPAEVAAALRLYDQGVRVREISARLCVPMTEVQRLIVEHRPAAAARDLRVDAVIAAACSSHRQRTRNLGERLKASWAETRAVVEAEAVERAERERKAAERKALRDKADELQRELSKVRKALRGEVAAR